ncbi:hypothetical protein [Planotetraspora kaengkrachanensis]|uniref:Uncharacterized protein n=1 Tax=Planotetraspora kaengkrachanensis TaxID=575193 RepID=A0A8J3PTJ7_9ACTN|nr:hypothetical protein [Planotetraspora kaengkrachanensis]GIG80051.1 hypothetical protein Pka01_31780 [Planotetraspora kaengkrachanensis]
MGDKVPNPQLADLKKLRADWAAEYEEVKTAIDRPAKDFGGGEVISGAWRDKQAPEITGRKDRVHRLVDDVLDAIDAAIKGQPEEVSENEARNYRRMRAGRLG